MIILVISIFVRRQCIVIIFAGEGKHCAWMGDHRPTTHNYTNRIKYFSAWKYISFTFTWFRCWLIFNHPKSPHSALVHEKVPRTLQFYCAYGACVDHELSWLLVSYVRNCGHQLRITWPCTVLALPMARAVKVKGRSITSWPLRFYWTPDVRSCIEKWVIARCVEALRI